jgi:ATP-dependent helicase/nuclease subunit A
MNEPLVDGAARERFRSEWDANFAVSANAGSGKTTAISERLAAIALAPGGADRLRKTAVVTYTKKAAAQIGQRARQVLLRRIAAAGSTDLAPLDHLERAFFGTIHSFCLKLAQTHGQAIGLNLNPTVIADDDEAWWEEFLEQDSMAFGTLDAVQLGAFLRHVPLEEIFAFARDLDAATAKTLRQRRPIGPRPLPNEAAGDQLLALVPKGSGAKNVQLSQERARAWREAWTSGAAFLPVYAPVGTSKALVEAAEAWMAPLKRWLGDAAAALAAELAERYRAWRFQRGVQTYSDQIDAAISVLGNSDLLDRVRREGWRIILDEAQDTDPQQFAVLVEIARPPGARCGEWPAATGSGAGPRAGHFCMVGDGQQAIYGRRADIGNFLRHVDAFARGDSGELLHFQVTFRAPRAVIDVLNATLPAAFGSERAHNFGVPPQAGAPMPFLQVPYVPLEPGTRNVAGSIHRLPLSAPPVEPRGVDAWLGEEAKQLGAWLGAHGPAALGAPTWGDVAVLAPRNDWLLTARKALEGAGLEVALQTRNHRCGDNPAYAWLAGLLAVCVEPENYFEWVGVLREIFGVSDALLAAEMKSRGSRLAWEEPSQHPEPLAGALATVRPFVLRANDAGKPLADFLRELVVACGLASKAERLDPSGSIGGELDRLLAEAADAGIAGASARDFLASLLRGRDDGRAAGKPSANAINLLTSHSAKGLEWQVVIILGAWRGIGQAPERGLKLVRDANGTRVFFDTASLPPDTREARDRERMRELTRLLYVTLTRARQSVVIPWAESFGGRQREKPSFAELWGADIAALPAPRDQPEITAAETAPRHPLAVAAIFEGVAQPLLPARLLPHELAKHQDEVRSARHESGEIRATAAVLGDEAIDYGLWWHETMEFLPWTEDVEAVRRYREETMAAAKSKGFHVRGAEEWDRLLLGPAWPTLRDDRWTRMAELGIFAPLRRGAWIDGVIDLVLHDDAKKELWIVDWKTNRRRRGESNDALLERLVAEYAPQLRAYGECAAALFPGVRTKLLVYSTAAGTWREVATS